MQSFFSRHRRRASPRPADDRGNEDLNITSPNNRRRRRHLQDTEGASLLPMTYEHSNNNSSNTPIKQRLGSSSPLVTKSTANSNISRHYGAAGGLPLMAPGSSTCNSFLMGGHYYPGKDKKRKQYFQRRRNTCWHRVFCSSTWRMVGSTIVVAYLIVWHVIVPATDMVLEYGRLWAGPPSKERMQYELRHHRKGKRRKYYDDIHGTIQWLLHDATLHLPSLQQRREEMEKLQGERERLQFGSEDRFQLRKAIWEEIVPDWFHRNDPNTLNSGGTGSTGNADPGVGREEETKQGDAVADEANKNGEAEAEDNQHGEAQRPIDENNNSGEEPRNLEGHRRLLTLENMDEFANQTSCSETLSPDLISTTLVIQSSLERTWILEETCQRWKDPIVVVLWLPSHTVSPWSPSWKDSCPQMKLIQYHASPDEDVGSYPVNHLRNLGLQAVETSHVLVVDIDFVPSHQLYQDIRSVLLEQQQHHQVAATQTEREALVVPAFERLLSTPCTTVEECKVYLQKDTSFLPRTFAELQDCVASNKCSVFQSQVNWEGHYSTRSEAWLAEDWYDYNETAAGLEGGGTVTNKSIKAIRCFDSLRYEPYVVLRWCPASSSAADAIATSTEQSPKQQHHPVAPFYDERFYGYGKNKIELISHLRFMGYRFAILPRGFLIHHPHPESIAKETWTGRRDPKASQTTAKFDLHQAMDRLYTKFLTQLTTKYQGRMHEMIQPCSHN